MELTIILGPMKSGKSFDLISFFAPLKYSNTPYALYQSARNVRDGRIYSRNGVELEAKKIESLYDIELGRERVVGIDEIHMFQPEDTPALLRLLEKGAHVIVSGLDIDYQGKLFDIVARLLELGPKEVRYRRAVCDICKHTNAIYTQVLHNNVPITSGMPSVLPDDGTFSYLSACRNCFVWKDGHPYRPQLACRL